MTRFARMESKPDRPEQFELIVEAPSPTGDPNRTLVVWMEDGEPSLGFGDWHTHAGLFGEIRGAGCDGLLATARAIYSDQFVLCYQVCGEDDEHCGVIDLRDPDALADELTSKGASGALDLRSWGGSADGRVTLNSL